MRLPFASNSGRTTDSTGSSTKALILRLDPDDDEAERKARMGIEKRTEMEVRRELARIVGELYPADSDPNNAYAESVRAAQMVTGERMRDILSRALQDSADLGVSVAVRKLEGVGYGFDYTLANESARNWALRYTDDVLAQLGTTTSRIVGQAVGRWVGNGEPLQSLVRDLQPAFGKQRARLIASTEITRAYAEGSKEAFIESGVVTKLVWQASMDERVCIYCGSLHGKIVGIEESFDGKLPADLRAKVRPFAVPPAHPGCRCWLSPQVEEVAKPKPKPKPKPAPEPPKPIATPPTPTPSAEPIFDYNDPVQVRARMLEIGRATSRREDEIESDLIATAQEIKALEVKVDRLAESYERRKETEQAAQVQNALDKAKSEYANKSAERTRLLTEQNQLRAEEQRQYRDLLSVSDPAQVRIPAGSPANWQEGVDDFNRLVSRSVTGGSDPTFVQMAPGGRAYYDPDRRTVNVTVDGKAKIITHELGHWLEETNPDILRQALTFYDRRTVGYADEWMGPGYSATETTKRDKFLHEYMGKTYGRDATEIVSMGIEYMLTKPAILAKQDADYFDFIFNLVRGR